MGAVLAVGFSNGLVTVGVALGVTGDGDVHGVLNGLSVRVGAALAAGVSNRLVTAGVAGGVSGVKILTAHCNASGCGPLFDGVWWTLRSKTFALTLGGNVKWQLKLALHCSGN